MANFASTLFMKKRVFIAVVSYLFLSVLLTDTVCSLINHFGFHNTEQLLLITEAETNTKDKDHGKDVSLNEYYLNHTKLRLFDMASVTFARLQIKETNLNTQSFYPAIPTPPPNT